MFCKCSQPAEHSTICVIPKAHLKQQCLVFPVTHLIEPVSHPLSDHECEHERQAKCDAPSGFYQDHCQTEGHTYYTTYNIILY